MTEARIGCLRVDVALARILPTILRDLAPKEKAHLSIALQVRAIGFGEGTSLFTRKAGFFYFANSHGNLRVPPNYATFPGNSWPY